ncbi:LCP family protein [Microbacterium excoecariae]|uniref:LCP family protein n=1 Tax=Microbacterium excoecariae TaxID=2715210 RepID=UPI00140B1063|nr:LCP family protein [Microbacterium excoecariae]NHI17480.1 LCP family protein [Microbacterium excoecariae]
MRTPDVDDARLMTRRAWWLVVLNFVIPGSAQAVAGGRRLGKVGLAATLVMWALGALTLLGVLLWRSATMSLLLHPVTLWILGILVAAYAVLWVVLSLDTLRLVRLVRTRTPARWGIAALAIVLAVLQGATGAVAAPRIFAAAGGLGALFTNAAPVVPPSDGYYNVLLLGADSGDGRDSMRFDSISVVSVNAETGAVTITGIPRDLQHFPFSESSPMTELYPNYFEGHSDPSCGWSSGINQLTNAVVSCREDGGAGLYPDAADEGSTPAIEATKDAAEGLLGIDVHYYVAIDMQGFASLIDSLGGVDITVDERLPEGPGPAYEGQSAEEWATGWIEEGEQHMDGETALWYARSRYTTSDWDRMERQRELQAAIIAQMTPQNVLSRFQEVAAAGTSVVSTDVPQGLVSTFVDLAVDARSQPVTTLELNPDAGVDQEWPDADAIHAMIDEALHPAGADSAE